MLRENFKLKMILIILVGLIVVGYAVFRLWDLTLGPHLAILYPADGVTLTQTLVTVRGQAWRISNLWLNDRQIFTDQAGNFEESTLLAPGYNILTLRARDRFGRQVSKKLELILEE